MTSVMGVWLVWVWSRLQNPAFIAEARRNSRQGDSSVVQRRLTHTPAIRPGDICQSRGERGSDAIVGAQKPQM